MSSSPRPVNGSRPTVGALLSGLFAPKVFLDGWFGTPVVTRVPGAGPAAGVLAVAGAPAAAADGPPGAADAAPTVRAPTATDGLAATGPD
jgi:hypothetical protein